MRRWLNRTDTKPSLKPKPKPKPNPNQVRRWLNWTDTHRDLVLATRALPLHGKPTAGALDGTAMLRPASCTGALSLFVQPPP